MGLDKPFKKNKELIAALMFCLPQLNYYVVALLTSFELRTFTTEVYLLVSLLAILAYLWTLSDIRCLLATGAAVLALLLSYLLFPDTGEYLFSKPLTTSGAVMLMLYYFPVFLLLLSGLDLERLLICLARFSTVILAAAALAFANYLFLQHVKLPDYMSFAYFMLSAIFFCFFAGVKGKIFHLVLAIIGSVMILVGGCRGAFLTLLVFYLLCLFFLTDGKKSKRAFVGKLFVILLAILVFVLFDTITDWLDSGLSRLGYSSRTLRFISDTDGETVSSIIEKDGRSTVWDQAVHSIGLLGKGLFGDRTVLHEHGVGTYAHNWILELLIDFGLILGPLAVAGALYSIFGAFFKAKRSGQFIGKAFSIAMVSILLVKHMMSASLLTSFDFWMYFGVAVSLMMNRSKTTEERSPGTDDKAVRLCEKRGLV